jgi:hypothetical protein
VLEAVFVLLESPSPYRRIFIGSHSLPPLWFAVSVLQLESDMVVNSLSPATLHLQISSRPVRISPAPSHCLQPSQRVVLHLDAIFFDASTAPTDELVAVDCFVKLVDLIRSENLIVIVVYFKELFVKAV